MHPESQPFPLLVINVTPPQATRNNDHALTHDYKIWVSVKVNVISWPKLYFSFWALKQNNPMATSSWNCYRQKWCMLFLTEYWEWSSYAISRKRIFWDVHGRMNDFYLCEIVSLGFQNPIPARRSVAGVSIKLKAKPGSRVPSPCYRSILQPCPVQASCWSLLYVGIHMATAGSRSKRVPQARSQGQQPRKLTPLFRELDISNLPVLTGVTPILANDLDFQVWLTANTFLVTPTLLVMHLFFLSSLFR